MLDDIRDGHIIAPHRLAKRLDIPMGQLARMVRADATVLTTAPASLAVQSGLDMIERIIIRATALSGDEQKAIRWFRHQRLSGFGQTAAALVEAGRATAVLWTLGSMEQGVYT